MWCVVMESSSEQWNSVGALEIWDMRSFWLTIDLRLFVFVVYTVFEV